MPEGDVLRRTATRLDQALAGQQLTRAELRWPSVATVDLVGARVLGTEPYGKHLMTRFDDGRTLHTHLRMDGTWRTLRTGSPQAAARAPDIRAVLGTPQWTAVGRLLGMVDVVQTSDEHTLIGHLGPDILASSVDVDELLRRWAGAGPRPVAEVLLDQRVVAGIGTVFMAESLFAEQIWPWTAADEVADPARLLLVARKQMRRSVLADERPERVHGRLHRPCRRCGTAIAVGQANEPPYERPVFYCPRCQPPGATGMAAGASAEAR
ncbi:DNA-formamidopyrimidine glycosylase family protein [Cellulomonas edaphi]|uniref:DNA-(apurinic or apyrimidinic site) lyase n=1 Tax=Cellulomonas edaphi TaxID=3053468 RepID=A0ABT7S8X4_9CELL|nr:DNA-formamidopyrimidine glycosylase family protein [Cellulomons edaphi]MDM7832077.1 DNA-formamidopyrimidine glycosylase family protein [Cellulomons edaphi]